MGGIQQAQGQHEASKQAFLQAMRIFERAKQPRQVAKMLVNLSEAYQKQHRLDSAIHYAQRALELTTSLEMPADIGFSNGILAKVLLRQNKPAQALGYSLVALPYFEQAGMGAAEAEYRLVASQAYRALERWGQAQEQAEMALAIAQRTQARNWEKDAYRELMEIQRRQGRPWEALDQFDRYEALKDSIYSQQIAEQLSRLQHSLDSERKRQQLLLQSEQIKALETRRQYSMMLIAALVGIVASISYLLYALRKRNRLLQRQHAAIREQQEEIIAQRNHIQEKNEEIARKNHDIMSSLEYAKRIQQTILPAPADIISNFADAFILLRPRDVVSGDFYWFAKASAEDGRPVKILAAVDSTGHGVPGALMSMIGIEQLLEIVTVENRLDPGDILNRLHEGVVMLLKQEQGKNADGMDMALCAIDETRQQLHFAGARNGLVYFQQGEMHVLKGDKASIGGRSYRPDHQFITTTIDISKPTACYLFSDGFQDQFGGKENKKFSGSQLRNLLASMHTQRMDTQQMVLEETLRQWMAAGQEEQIDDILVMGFRVGGGHA
jgi:serine phosphatase RsbU (regulator of sigma subunit)